MSLALRAALRGDLEKMMADEARAVARAPAVAAAESAMAIQNAWRAQVSARFKRGRRVAGAIRRRSYQDDGGAAAVVFNRFGGRRAGRYVDFLIPHAEGATLRPTMGRWLYIPLTCGRRAKKVRISSELNKNVRFVNLGDGRALLVRASKTRSTPIALLVRKIRIPKSLNLDRAVRSEQQKLPRRLLNALERGAP